MAGQTDKHGKTSKARRNYRVNGEHRGPSPDTASSTKYMRSGGDRRSAVRKAARHGCNAWAAHHKPLTEATRAHSHKARPATIAA